MQRTIPNESAGTIRSWIHDHPDEWYWIEYRKNVNLVDFKRIRVGNKDYGFIHKSNPNTFVARYKCSWVEADRRFKLLLISRRMMK
jgi:hypothetical protein